LSTTTDPQLDLITIADAAERLSVSTKTVRRYIADGTLLAVRIGPRLVRIPAASLSALGAPIGWAGKL
jgi:excisionase family DNA binding protein